MPRWLQKILDKKFLRAVILAAACVFVIVGVFLYEKYFAPEEVGLPGPVSGEFPGSGQAPEPKPPLVLAPLAGNGLTEPSGEEKQEFIPIEELKKQFGFNAGDETIQNPVPQLYPVNGGAQYVIQNPVPASATVNRIPDEEYFSKVYPPKFVASLNTLQDFILSDGRTKPVIMGSYGLGPGRLIGTIAEIYHDVNGLMWPEAVAPFRVHLIEIGAPKEAEKFYDDLEKKGIEVLYDDRKEKTPGEKFADADLIGLPYRVVVSERTLEKKSVEIKKRDQKEEPGLENMTYR